MIIKQSLLLTLLISAVSLAADNFDPVQTISRTRQWKLLLHMEKKEDLSESRIDSPRFFLNKKGKIDPDKELKSTLIKFRKKIKGDVNKHPLCRFPARRMFLEKTLKLKFQNIYCKDFENWKKGVDPKGIALIFASSYPNNPASMFGHTFIRFKKGKRENDLLDYGASFGAMVDGSDNPVLYAMKGLFGQYRAGFSLSPYYQKVNEYAQIESRDLWEYELKLEKSEIDLILAHLWELYYNAWFDYWFLDENCSYTLAALLNVGNPTWNLVEDHKWFVMPHDVVKRVTREIPLRSVKFRPGVKKVLEQRIKYLNEKEKKDFENLIKNKKVKNERITSLDTALDYFNYKKMKAKGRLTKQSKKLYRKLLKRRARRKESSPLVLVSSQNRPETGHQSSLLSLGMAHDKEDLFFEFSNYQIFKDWTDTDMGYEPFSRVEAFGLEVEAGDERITMKKIEFISVTSHTPLNTIDPGASWEVNSNIKRVSDYRCDYCMAINLEGKIGISFMNKNKSLFSVLAGGFTQVAKDLPDGHSAGWIATSRIGHAANKKLKFYLEGNIKSDLANKSSQWILGSTAGMTIGLERLGDIKINSNLSKTKDGREVIVHKLGMYFYY
ncbi:MAG: DUF4105 domain-containing protein [Bacteriovoracaceae bacterium]|nr:DUF4105 domain-containing protein [Bacteriovoracaceae bacterium]